MWMPKQIMFVKQMHYWCFQVPLATSRRLTYLQIRTPMKHEAPWHVITFLHPGAHPSVESAVGIACLQSRAFPLTADRSPPPVSYLDAHTEVARCTINEPHPGPAGDQKTFDKARPLLLEARASYTAHGLLRSGVAGVWSLDRVTYPNPRDICLRQRS